MPHDHRISHHSRKDDRPQRRVVHRRTDKRQTVQSDELSSTNGARLVSSSNPYDPNRNPHLSSSLPPLSASGVPHPKSPAARAQERNARQRAMHENSHPSFTGEHLPVAGTHVGERVHAGHTGSFTTIDQGTIDQHMSLPPINPSATGAHAASLQNDPIGADASIAQQPSNPAVTGSSAYVTEAPKASYAPEADQTPMQAQADRTASQERISTPSGTPYQNYQDYSAASGRYKAHSSANSTTSGFKPIFADAQHSRRRKKTWPRIVAAVAILFAVGFGGYFIVDQVAYAGPIEATVNGETMTLQGNERSIEGLLDNNIVSVTPGNYVAVDNSVMREGDGTRCSAIINEKEISDLSTRINQGDQVVVSNGTDVMEAYTDSEPTVIPAGYAKVGQWGAIHVFLPGQDGETVTRTGSESGISLEQVTKEKIDERLAYYNADSNGEKVVALTFDDGPWDTTTDQILDILKENDAKATFYTIGQQVPLHTEQIKRMADEGHEIATHTWDHADGSGKGVSLDLMSTSERRDEVQKGLDIIKEISGKDASIYFRAPGGNFGESTANDLKDLISGEIGWNVDTEDWRRPGAEVIAERIKSVQPGGIVLMHDGGGDRSQTVAGLREAITYLKDQGYKFVTISELIESYPYQEGQHS
jgi:peptidoglycan/xylan/chitin deacetylase (PgdA/CDA1 family)